MTNYPHLTFRDDWRVEQHEGHWFLQHQQSDGTWLDVYGPCRQRAAVVADYQRWQRRRLHLVRATIDAEGLPCSHPPEWRKWLGAWRCLVCGYEYAGGRGDPNEMNGVR